MLKPEVLSALSSIDNYDDIKEAFDYLKSKATTIQAKTAKAFYPGQKVQWNGKRGHVEGIVKTVNRSTVSVMVGTAQWNVSPSLLRTAL